MNMMIKSPTKEIMYKLRKPNYCKAKICRQRLVEISYRRSMLYYLSPFMYLLDVLINITRFS